MSLVPPRAATGMRGGLAPLARWLHRAGVGANTVTNSRSGGRSPRARIDSAPYIPPSIDASIDGEWSWYGQTPAESRPAR